MSQPLSHWHVTASRLPTGEAHPPQRCEIAVVGGGLLGISTAYWLARAGLSPLIIERQHPAAGATGRNGGFMVAGTATAYPHAVTHYGEEVTRGIWDLTLTNRLLLHQVLAEEAIDCDYREPGHLNLAVSPEQLEAYDETVTALQQNGFSAQLLDRAALQRLIATPLGEQVLGGIFRPDDGLLHSARFIYGLTTAAIRHGARLLSETTVQQIDADQQGVRLHTSRGLVEAGAAIIAVNAWTSDLVPRLAGTITPVRGQVLAYEPIAPVFREGFGASITPTGEYWQQALDGTIVIGGCRAAAPGWDVGVRDATPSDEVQQAIEKILPQLFPQLPALRVARRWAGLMAFTKDYLPIAGAAPDTPNTWVVGGFCGHGMPFGLVLGQALADTATGKAAPALNFFPPTRFG